MTALIIPDALYELNEKPTADIHMFDYCATSQSERTRITLHQNVFSFVTQGFKSVSYLEKSVQIDDTQFMLLGAGNCLMTQRMASQSGLFKSILLFFDNSVVVDFFLKYAAIITKARNQVTTEQPALVFHQDDFIRNFVQSLALMIKSQDTVPKEMKRLKFEEIMLYLLDKYPDQILSLQSKQESAEDFQIRRMVEENLESNMTVEELAFLCNTSLSTFKRRFARIYSVSPNKWMQLRRLERAANLLEHHNEKPTDVYYKVGYETLSSFIESFKKVYGVTPKEFQLQKLNV